MLTAAKARQVYTDEQRAAVKAQLERLVHTPFFSHSRRLPAFLLHVVERTLEGHTEDLKERTLGVEVFGKSPTYDTASDPIVRVTAAEVRKRIAQYYQDPEHQRELRLALPPGSYVPTFDFMTAKAEPEPVTPPLPQQSVSQQPVYQQPPPQQPLPQQSRPELLAVPVAADPLATRHARQRSQRLYALLALAILLCVGVTGVLAKVRQSRRTAFVQFWEPILGQAGQGDPVLFCIADQTHYTSLTLRDANDPSRQVTLKDNLTAVIIDDVATTVKVAGVLQSSGRHYTLRGESATTLSDLRSGPAVIIGAFSNEWTLRLLRPLRFHFTNNPEMTAFSIVDGTGGNANRWTVDRARQIATNNYKDYAIVARFTDVTTGKPTLIAAGIGRGGTIAAGELLSNPELLRRVHDATPATGSRDVFASNIEIVLSTTIINGEPGTPAVEAVYTW